MGQLQVSGILVLGLDGSAAGSDDCVRGGAREALRHACCDHQTPAIADKRLKMQATINGVRLAYTDEGHGTPLVLIHGFPLSRGAWQKQVDAFKATRRV